MMMTEDLPEDLKGYIRNLERKVAQLEKDLEKERADKEKSRQRNKKLKEENEQLKRELARLKGSAPVLAGSDKTAEAGGIPRQRLFTDETDRKEIKNQVTVNQGIRVMEERNRLQTRLRHVSHWKSARNAAHHWANP